MWVHAFWIYNHAGQHINNALESYHRVLKGVYLKEMGNNKRLVWTVHKLLQSEQAYWFEEQNVINGTVRNMREF